MKPISVSALLCAVLAVAVPTVTSAGQQPTYFQQPSLWPVKSGVIQIPYELRNTAVKGTLEKAIKVWHDTGRIRFYEVTPRKACARMVIFATHPKFPVPCSATFGYKGRDADANVMTTAKCGTLADYVHELGHAAGLAHEHQRKERDASITLTKLPPGTNYTQAALENFVWVAFYSQPHPYAYLSVMHYAFTKPAGVPDNALWTSKPPPNRTLFHFTDGQSAKFKNQHPGIKPEVIGANSGTVSSLDVQALTHLYTLKTASDADISHVCPPVEDAP